MPDRPTRVRTGVTPEQPRATKTNKKSEKDAALDRARCAEIAMLAAARGWGKKRRS
jgi:hypothetical protein